MAATACQSPQLIAIYDALDGTNLADPSIICTAPTTWLARVEHSGVAVEVSTCDACTALMRITPSFRWARALAAERANV
jgi:hypothetical protein